MTDVWKFIYLLCRDHRQRRLLLSFASQYSNFYHCANSILIVHWFCLFGWLILCVFNVRSLLCVFLMSKSLLNVKCSVGIGHKSFVLQPHNPTPIWTYLINQSLKNPVAASVIENQPGSTLQGLSCCKSVATFQYCTDGLADGAPLFLRWGSIAMNVADCLQAGWSLFARMPQRYHQH